MLQPHFLHVIVEAHGGQWTAWIKGTPEAGYGGEWPTDAIRRLLRDNGWDEYDVDEIVALEENICDGHLEFLIPSNERWNYPVPVSWN